MPIKELPMMAYLNEQPAFYDVDSVTAIEMTGKLYNKTNDLIKAFNEFIASVNAEIEAFEGNTAEELETFERGLRQEFQDFIDSVDLKISNHTKSISDELMQIALNVETLIVEEVAKKPLTLSKMVVYEGAAIQVGYGNTITLSDSLENYNYFEVEGYISSAQNTFKCGAIYSPTGYQQDGAQTFGNYYGSGGYWYHILVHVGSDGALTGGVRLVDSTTSGLESSSVYITKIIGYKF